MLEREVHIIFDFENQWELGLRETEAVGVSGVPLKGLMHGSLSSGLIFSDLHCWSISRKAARDKQEGTELSGIRAKTGGANFFQTEVLAETIFSFLSPPPTQPAPQQVGPFLSLHQPS